MAAGVLHLLCVVVWLPAQVTFFPVSWLISSRRILHANSCCLSKHSVLTPSRPSSMLTTTARHICMTVVLIMGVLQMLTNQCCTTSLAGQHMGKVCHRLAACSCSTKPDFSSASYTLSPRQKAHLHIYNLFQMHLLVTTSFKKHLRV